MVCLVLPTNMSTISTVTTSAAPDLTLGNDNETGNQICMLVATHANGTSLHSTSFHQEDTVVMCEGLGQECPKGVLWFMEMEMVLTFWSNSEMMAASCQLVVATVWCGNPIVLFIWSPSAKHIRDYVAAGSSHSSDASAQGLIDGVKIQPPLSKPSPDEGLQWTLTRDICELDNDQLWKVLEAIRFETARREWQHPYTGHPWPTHGSLGWQWSQMAYEGVKLEVGRGWWTVEPVQWPTSPPTGWCRWQLPSQHAHSWATPE